MTATLPGQIRRGVLWGGANAAVMRMASFAVGVVTARLIAPEQFGVFAVALTAYSIVVHINELGVSAVLTRQTDDREVERLAPTVVTIALASSTLLTVALWVTAPAVASALGAPEAAGPIRVISLAVVLAGFSAVPNALLVRSFRQDRLAMAGAANFLVSTTVVITLALAGGGALALSTSQVAGQLVGTIAITLLAPRRFLPGFNRTRAKELLRFGLPLAGANVFNFSVYNVDYIVIGHLLGPEALGLYLLAFNISGWPSSVLNAMVNSVAMPAFARVRHDRARIGEFLSRTLSVVSGVTFPVSALVGALAVPVVVAVYGPEWRGAAPALTALAMFGAIRVMTELFSNVIVALGHPRAILAVQVGWLTLLVPAMYLSVEAWGVTGAGVAHSLVIGGFVLPALVAVLRWTAGVRPSTLGRAVLVPAVGAVLTGCIAFVVAGSMDGPWAALLAGVAAGGAVTLVLTGRWLLGRVRIARTLWGTAGSDADEGTDVAVPGSAPPA